MDKFHLSSEDKDAVQLAIKLAREFLKRPDATPRMIIGLGNALFALERLPLVTPGASVEFGIEYRSGTKEYSEVKVIDIGINESEFEISIGGSVYDKEVGSDSISDPGWIVRADGSGERECDLREVESSISSYLELGAQISVSDDSNIDFSEIT